jgi:iron-sulfur cluster repair protein YtfE (RIC family)
MKAEIDIFNNEDGYNETDFLNAVVSNVSNQLYQDLKSHLLGETDIINKLINKRVSDIMKNDIRNMVQKQVNDKLSDIYSYIDRVTNQSK